MPQCLVAVAIGREDGEVGVRQPHWAAIPELLVHRIRVRAVGRIQQLHQEFLRAGDTRRGSHICIVQAAKKLQVATVAGIR